MVFETNANVVNDSHDGVWRVDLTRAESIMGRILRLLSLELMGVSSTSTFWWCTL